MFSMIHGVWNTLFNMIQGVQNTLLSMLQGEQNKLFSMIQGVKNTLFIMIQGVQNTLFCMTKCVKNTLIILPSPAFRFSSFRTVVYNDKDTSFKTFLMFPLVAGLACSLTQRVKWNGNITDKHKH